jgi:23S rRNA (uridine2552-2'-O)-methyltransferase
LTKRWLRDHRKDPYYRRAKAQGYRSRASYKLMQISLRFDIIRVGNSIVDLGCAPGGWLQVAVELTGPTGTVVGVDLDKVKPLEGATILRGDMKDPEVARKVYEALPEGRADVVLSDMSPNISGNYNIDHAKSIELAETAFDFACKVLRPRGRFVAKVFVGDMYRDYLKEVAMSFESCRAHHPKASRSTSSETYVIGKGFRPARAGHFEKHNLEEE